LTQKWPLVSPATEIERGPQIGTVEKLDQSKEPERACCNQGTGWNVLTA